MADELQIIVELLLKYLSGQPLEEAEKLLLQAWLDESPDNALLLEQMQTEEWMQERLSQISKVDKEKIWAPVATYLEEQKAPPVRKISRWKYVAAAAILCAIAGGIFVLTRPHKAPATTMPQVYVKPAPHNRAVLTLADGSAIILNKVKDGELAKQGNAQVMKQGGKLLYVLNPMLGQSSASELSNGAEMSVGAAQKTVTNKLTVAKSGMYELQLPDSTLVWMNSASSLEYPAVFTGKYRDVALYGEAYFEVTKKRDHPFRVFIKDVTVTAIGTAFNIRCYNSEHSVRTTLANGGVSVRKGDKIVVLKPGQQARVDSGAKDIQVISDANVDGALSWKNGYFHFDDMDIPSAVYELARWYDKDVHIEKVLPQGPLSLGNIQRSLPLKDVLENLQRNDLHFKLDNKTIIVTP